MTKTRSNNTVRHGSTVPENKKIVDGTDCLWARLVQYDAPRDPLLAECTRKPQPYSVRFPYTVEVARAKKMCPMYRHTAESRTPELRPKRRFSTMAANVKPEPQQTL